MNKTSNIFARLGYLYLVIPILIFFIGWCNLPTAIIGSIVIIVSLYFSFKNAPQLWLPQSKKQIMFLISIFIISLIWVYLSGIGALVFQNGDHNCRNPIFEMLVTEHWPVYHSEQPAVLTYYIAFWLPSAIVGKLFNSIQIGYYFQILWASLGIFLFFYYILALLRKKNYIPVLIFIFFSGLDIVGVILKLQIDNFFNLSSHIEWWSSIFQFSSMTTQLFWVFNQAIATWLIVPLLSLEKNNKSIGFLYACLFLHSTLPAIGIFPFILYWCFKNGQKKITVANFKSAFLSLFTFQNTIGAILVFVVCYLYLSSNISGGNINTILYLINDYKTFFVLFITFFFLEAGIYFIAISKIYYKKIIYYIALFCLLIYPFITIGFSADFCMRASIPALVVLYILIVKAIEKRYYYKKCVISCVILILALSIGAITPIHEFYRTIKMTGMGITKIKSDMTFRNFYGYEQNNKFLKYFGK